MKRTAITALSFLLALPMATATAETIGYSVKSDAEPNIDRLHRIDLENGSASSIGVPPVSSIGDHKDVEGLAFASDSSLWAVDNDRWTLFQINPATGNVVAESERKLSGPDLDEIEGHDFGLTFTCDGTLYATSVITQTLYTIDGTGKTSTVGAKGNLGANISAIAAYGNNPVRMFGLSNGLAGDFSLPSEYRFLYEINLADGTAAMVGLEGIGDAVADYHEAGLSFDDKGQLWAITDRSLLGAPGTLKSQILRLDTDTGIATLVAETGVGFESLAVAPPGGCEVSIGPGPKQEAGSLQPVPGLARPGQLLAIFVLMLSGIAALHRRII